MKKVVAFGSDHVGFDMKNEIIRRLGDRYEILDAGPLAYDAAADYPDFAEAAAKTVAKGKAWRGILICGSGVGVCVAANKVRGVRACVCHDTFSAHQGVEHVDIELAWELVGAFLNAEFGGEARHQRRLDKLLAIERRSLGGS
ncbi:MAG: RpiB/LacA/LacB family sugar-phosphate isomerase [Chloroflexi bacterium]|nr:RpiB/LacA/LacB family sugar-phosphate isomerase [Chloroflexota bacterium]